jgi:hypothetical protein
MSRRRARRGVDGGWARRNRIGLLTEAYIGLPLRTYIRTRAWNDVELDAAAARLHDRGWLAAESLTEAGRRERELIERATDAAMRPAIAAIGADVHELLGILEPWGVAIRDAGDTSAVPSICSPTAADQSPIVRIRRGRRRYRRSHARRRLRFPSRLGALRRDERHLGNALPVHQGRSRACCTRGHRVRSHVVGSRRAARDWARAAGLATGAARVETGPRVCGDRNGHSLALAHECRRASSVRADGIARRVCATGRRNSRVHAR